jgi:hypothetical protein
LNKPRALGFWGTQAWRIPPKGVAIREDFATPMHQLILFVMKPPIVRLFASFSLLETGVVGVVSVGNGLL